MSLGWVVVLSGAILSGCSDPPPADPPLVCLDAGAVDAACTPAYEPTSYGVLYENTLKPTCAKSGISCHASTGKQAGLNFDDEADSYAGLHVKWKVKPGSPECSTLVHRVVATDGKVRMPPGRSIPVGEQCAIIRWIANGAPR